MNTTKQKLSVDRVTHLVMNRYGKGKFKSFCSTTFPFLSRMNSALKSHFLKIHFNIIPQLCIDLSDYFRSNDKINKYLISVMRATCPTDQGRN